jgi:hypothetical protein
MTHHRVRALAAAAALLTVPVLAACGGGSSKPAASASTPASQSSSPAVSATAPADTAAATAAITANWKTFFNYSTSRARAAELLENGATMGAALAFAVKEQTQTHFKQGAKVTGVTFTGPTTAQVTYQLLNGTTVVLPAASGQAVLQDGTWKVAKSTFCTLVLLGNNNNPVSGC